MNTREVGRTEDSECPHFSSYTDAVRAAIARKKQLGESSVYPATIFSLGEGGKRFDRRDVSGDTSFELAIKRSLERSSTSPPMVEVHWHNRPK